MLSKVLLLFAITKFSFSIAKNEEYITSMEYAYVSCLTWVSCDQIKVFNFDTVFLRPYRTFLIGP